MHERAPGTVCATRCLQRKGRSLCDRTGTEAWRDSGQGTRVCCPLHPRGPPLPFSAVPATPGKQEQPCLAQQSQLITRKQQPNFSKSVCLPILCPTLSRTSKPCWKIPLRLSCFHSYAPLEPRAMLQPLRSICSTIMWGGQWFLPCPQPPALPCEQRDLAFPSTPARRSLSRQARQKSLCHLCLGKGKAQGTRWRGEQGTDLAGRLTSLLGEVARKAKGRR